MSAIGIVGSITAPNSAALEPFRRVKLDTGVLAYAGANDTELGTLNERTFATDTVGSVLPFEDSNARWGIATGSFAAHSVVYSAADGKLANSGTYVRGLALTASAGAGDRFLYLPTRSASSGLVGRSGLVEDALQPYTIPLTLFRVHDALQTNLPATAASDDLAIITGTFGSDAPSIQANDFGGGSTTMRARVQFPLPVEYVAGEAVAVRIKGGMLTSVADASCTVDVECYKNGEGSDICATAAQSINSLTKADKDFTITPTGLVAGDLLDLRITIAGTDAGNAAVMVPEIDYVKVLCDIKG